MIPKAVLIAHTLVFGGLVVLSLGSPFILFYYPEFFSRYFFWGAVIVTPIVLILWRVFRGCPFTVWENHLHKRRNPKLVYNDSCIQHYGHKWFGLRISLWIIQPFLIALLVLPVVIGLL